ncbi:MAG: hypothetical protein AAGI44_15025 [Pseudomonadota bacterium]
MSSGASLSTRFSDAYKVRHPIACKGLAFAGMTPNLALAVNAAGGVSAVGMGMLPADYVASVVETMQDEFHLDLQYEGHDSKQANCYDVFVVIFLRVSSRLPK